MKFLDEKYLQTDIILLDVYYDKGTWSNSDDVLYIMFKELDTGHKRMVEIVAPDVEVHIVKDEYRNDPFKFDPSYIHDWVSKDMCDTYRVNYKNMNKEIGDILNISPAEVKTSPYVFGRDVGVERWYIHQFLKEYQSKNFSEPTAGFYDIETDTINEHGYGNYGEVPIPCVTYIDGPGKTCYTLIYHHSNILPSHPRYEELSTKYEKDYQYFITHLEEFVADLHESFDASYGRLEYIILTFENELEMIKSFFDIVRVSENDFQAAWNAPFDFGNLITRPSVLGVDPLSVVTTDFEHPIFAYKEDRAFNAVKRRHLMFAPLKTIWTDAMVNYAAIRSQKGKLPSVRLNYIAQLELQDEKLDYSEETDIKHFMYEDFIKFIKYNIKDVLLLLGIENKTRDLVDVVSRISAHGLPPRDVFGSLPMEDSSIIRYLDNYDRNECGYYVGSNRAKLGLNETKYNPDDNSEEESDEVEEYDFSSDDKDSDSDDVQYDGAIVLHPNHMTESGFYIDGTPKKYIHDHLIDMDITAEYPTACIIQNASNETFLGKIMFCEPLTKSIDIYPTFHFADKKEAADYNVDENTFIMEVYQQKQYGLVAEYVLGLPSIEEIFEMAESEEVDFYE